MALVLGAIITFYFSPNYVPQITAKSMGPFDLNQKPLTVIENKDAIAFTTTGSGTFSAFIYLSLANRTATYASCGGDGGSATASCENGEYSICTCGTTVGASAVTNPTDCSNCTHTGYKQIFNIGEILYLEVLVAPDASRQHKAAAQLVVKTANANNTFYESIVLPPIDLQKWTYVTVSRDGKRFDIFYNNTLVLSKSAQYILVPMGPTGVITSGSSGLEGKLLLANVYNYRLSSLDVSTKYAEYADTRGRPYFNDTANPLSITTIGGIVPTYSSTMFSGLASYIPTINLCPSGGCITSPNIQPANPNYTWATPYA